MWYVRKVKRCTTYILLTCHDLQSGQSAFFATRHASVSTSKTFSSFLIKHHGLDVLKEQGTGSCVLVFDECELKGGDDGGEEGDRVVSLERDKPL